MSTRITKAFTASTEALAEKRQVRVICSTEEVDRAGEVVVQSGIDFGSYMASGAGPVLWNHDTDKPIAKCIEIGVKGGQLEALVQFPPEGEDEEADRYYAKIKFGSVSGVSIGFAPVKAEPMEPGSKKGPQRYMASELLEFSFTPVQANRGSVVVARSTGQSKVGASRNLALDEVAGWDADAAAESIFEKAGFDGDSPDTTFARKGFLIYDASRPGEKGSYKLPFAKVEDGRLVAVASGIRAAAGGLLKADAPNDVAEKARAVIDHYEAKMTNPANAFQVRPDEKVLTGKQVKSLYDVARLACLLQELGYVESSAEWEAEYEGDSSPVPAMLGEAMRQLGDALIAMTAEEVAELLKEDGAEGEVAVKAGVVAPDAPPIRKAFAAAGLKAGRTFSSANSEAMRKACKSIRDGHDAIMGMIEPDEPEEGETEKAAAPDTGAPMPVLTKRQRMFEVIRRQAV